MASWNYYLKVSPPLETYNMQWGLSESWMHPGFSHSHGWWIWKWSHNRDNTCMTSHSVASYFLQDPPRNIAFSLDRACICWIYHLSLETTVQPVVFWPVKVHLGSLKFFHHRWKWRICKILDKAVGWAGRLPKRLLPICWSWREGKNLTVVAALHQCRWMKGLERVASSEDLDWSVRLWIQI